MQKTDEVLAEEEAAERAALGLERLQVLGQDGHWYIAMQWDGEFDQFLGIRHYMSKYGVDIGRHEQNGVETLNVFYNAKKSKGKNGGRQKLIWREGEWLVFKPDSRPRIYPWRIFERTFS